MDYRQTHRFMPPPPLAVPVPPPVTWYGGPFQYQPPSTNRRYDSCDEYRLYECRKIAESEQMSYRKARRFMPPPPPAVPVPTYGGPFQYQPPSTSTSRHVGYKSKRETRCDLCNDELYEAYRRKIEENDNFDVDPCPNCCRGSFAPGIQRVHHSKHPADFIRVYSEIALMKYNEKEGSDLELVKVVKANVKVVAGFLYYITFEAKDASSGDGRTSTFQAEVYHGVEEIIVNLVRPKLNA